MIGQFIAVEKLSMSLGQMCTKQCQFKKSGPIRTRREWSNRRKQV